MERPSAKSHAVLAKLGHCGIPSALIAAFIVRACKCAKSLQPCLTLCDPAECSSQGSSVYGILQARILEWFIIPFSRGSSQPRDRAPHILHCRQILHHLSHPGKPCLYGIEAFLILAIGCAIIPFTLLFLYSIQLDDNSVCSETVSYAIEALGCPVTVSDGVSRL